jgi:hypothetical protein
MPGVLECSPARRAALPPAGVAGAPTSALITPPTSTRGATPSGTCPVEAVMVGEAKGEGGYSVGEAPNIGGGVTIGAGDGGGNGEDNECAAASTVGAADAAAPGE